MYHLLEEGVIDILSLFDKKYHPQNFTKGNQRAPLLCKEGLGVVGG